MAISMRKKTRAARKPGEKRPEFILAGLSWDMRRGFGEDYDLDISCILLDKGGKARREKDFVYFNNEESSCHSVRYAHDNMFGEGDDERVMVDLPKIPADISRVVFCVSIYEGESRNQVFGMMRRVHFYVKNRKNNEDICSLSLNEAFGEARALMACEFYRHGHEWRFRPLALPDFTDLADIAKACGLEVED